MTSSPAIRRQSSAGAGGESDWASRRQAFTDRATGALAWSSDDSARESDTGLVLRRSLPSAVTAPVDVRVRTAVGVPIGAAVPRRFAAPAEPGVVRRQLTAGDRRLLADDRVRPGSLRPGRVAATTPAAFRPFQPAAGPATSTALAVLPPRGPLSGPPSPGAPPTPLTAVGASPPAAARQPRSLIDASADILRRSFQAGARPSQRLAPSPEHDAERPHERQVLDMARAPSSGPHIIRRLSVNGPIGDSSTEFSTHEPDVGGLRGAEFEELVERVADRIEQRVVDELARRGRYRVPEVF